MFISRNESEATGQLEAALLATVACEPIEKKLREAVKNGLIVPRSGVDTAALAKDRNVITAEELAQWQRKEALRKHVIKVDDFPQDFGRAEIVRAMEEKPVAARAA
jgi:acyl-CoA dehydrogenase